MEFINYVVIILYRQLCCEEKQVLSSRLEERQAEQQALSGQLTDAKKTNKKVCSSILDYKTFST